MNFTFLEKTFQTRQFADDDDFLLDIIGQLPNHARVLEVGAHFGKFSHHLLERFPQALIIEGDPSSYNVLCEKFFDAKDKIMNHVIYNDEKEHNWFWASKAQSNALIMPLEQPKSRGLIKSRVKTISLDSIDFNFDFIKTDCEGADFRILQGAERLLDKNRPLIYFEHSGEIGAMNHNYTKDIFFNFFDTKKYKLITTKSEQFSPHMWFADLKQKSNSYNLLAIPK